MSLGTELSVWSTNGKFVIVWETCLQTVICFYNSPQQYNMKTFCGYNLHPIGISYSTIFSLHYLLIWLLVSAHFIHFLSHSFCLSFSNYFYFIIYSVCPLFFLLFSPLLFLFWTLHGNQFSSHRRAVHSPLPGEEIHRSVS